jgi:NADPH-dependent 2,4-dienoyl-CoA reductase/sulfur reductase-like enzyme
VGTRRVVVVGADAAGMSAASQALRTAAAAGQDLEVVALESGTDVSYSSCGIPYWMARDVGNGDDLVARTAAEHRANGIDLRLRHEATALDLDRGEVEVRDHDGRRTVRIGFDDVLLATGAAPVLPDWATGVRGVRAVKSLEDGAAWLRLLDGAGGRAPSCALVVGAGYIGVEVAETFARRGLRTTLVTRGAGPMTTSFEPEMGVLVREALERAGVTVITGTEVSGLDAGPDGGVRAACIGGREFRADVVALGLGVRARTALATGAGIEVGAHGGLVPDDRQRLADGVWAAGDCCEVWDRLLAGHWFVPLGTHATKTGRVAGTNLGGGDARFAGVVGTAITRAGDAEVARTGLLRQWADRLGLATASVVLESTTAAGYMPEADPVTVWVLGERGTGRLLGCQVVGGRGAGKRIDVAATALWAGLTAEDVAAADLAYAPPFSPVWDPVQIACRKLAERL